MILALMLASVLGVTDLNGQRVDPFDVSAAGTRVRALVFVFMSTDCPVSNRYVPELNRLYAAYRDRGVRLWLVYSGGSASPEIVRAHHTAYGLRVPALLDPRFALAERSGATMTPEAAVYDVREQLVYRGRIDDRAQGLGRWRPVPTERDLADVLQRLGSGEEVTYRTTQAVGCYVKPLS